MTPDKIARICHEANRAYCIEIGDTSQPTWDEVPEWQRQSAVNGVSAHLAGTIATPKQSHELWLSEKVADGWVYGAVKDPIAKTHPCVLPYEQLPEEQRRKDRIFTAICSAFRP